MYPKVFADYAADRSAFGDVSALPTAVFFYGMEPGQEINIDLERGKTLIVRYVTTSDPHEDGTRTVFFELNGQPRPDSGRGSQPGGEAAAAAQGRSRATRPMWAPPCPAPSPRCPCMPASNA